MKKESPSLFTEMSKSAVANLTQVVKETLATNQQRSFGSVDLWNIHRQRRSASARRQFA
jgi:hypothetical protein